MNLYKHSGDVGDCIYSMPVIRALGKGKFLLASSKNLTRQSMDEKVLNLLKPLFLAQPYIEGIDLYRGEEVTHDLDTWRLGKDAQEWHLKLSLAEMHGFPFGVTGSHFKHRWIFGIDPIEFSPIIIHRSPRYQNQYFPWKKIVEKYRGKIAMVGLKFEHDAFCKEFGDVYYRPTENFYELAQVIAGSKLFIGNQSAPYAVAEGLKHNTIQETCLECPNCIFPRDNAQHVAGTLVNLPDV